jgi:hypothetical protein
MKKLNKVVLFLLAFLLGFFQSVANAALPAAVATGFTMVDTDFATLLDSYVWPLIIVISMAFLLIKLFKRGVGAV